MNIKTTRKSAFTMAVLLVALIFGAQPLFSISEAKASDERHELKIEDLDAKELDIEDAEDLEDVEIKDEDLLAIALQLKLLGRDLEKVFKHDENIGRMFDRDINRDLLTREDLAKSLILQEQLLAKADERIVLEDDSSGGNENRIRSTGVIRSMPANLLGNWVIGGRTFTAVPSTQFDELDGPLVVGGCAKVDIRNGRVHEIDSQQIGDCR
jgi:hypothetical protein